jgi:hypothetical protein
MGCCQEHLNELRTCSRVISYMLITLHVFATLSAWLQGLCGRGSHDVGLAWHCPPHMRVAFHEEREGEAEGEARGCMGGKFAVFARQMLTYMTSLCKSTWHHQLLCTIAAHDAVINQPVNNTSVLECIASIMEMPPARMTLALQLAMAPAKR